MDSPFRIEYLDAERMLPLLIRKAASECVNESETASSRI